MSAPPHVVFRDIGKRYGNVHALAGVDLAVERGSVHALVGENGAGKSTLGKILAGVIAPDEGEVRLAGAPVRFRGPRDALAAGVALVSQELALAPGLTVLENVYLGARPIGALQQRARAQELRALMDKAGLSVPSIDVAAGSLSIADQQKVEILRALARGAELIIFDEPTAPLTSDEAEKLYELIRGLQRRGTTIVYVSHFLDEILKLADTISVLKDGRHVQTGPAAEHTPATLISAMLGRSLDATFPDKVAVAAGAPVVLAVDGLTRKGAIEDVSFEVRAGEIVGLAGLVGSGRTEVARALFGADRATGGEVRVHGEAVRIRSPRAAIGNRIAMIPESRKEQGLLMTRPIRENLTLSHLGAFTRGGWVRRRAEHGRAGEAMRRLEIKSRSGEAPVSSLSGGNQQKVLIGKCLMQAPSVLIADEPTRGVDVGTKRAIYDLLRDLAGGGMAVVLISSELEEIQGLAHRILVMRKGRVVAEHGGDASDRQILEAAFGQTTQEKAAQ
jgi:rhamnose transport system ATP-binding protein